VAGHPGAARPRPEQIDRHESHQLAACPAGGPPVLARIETKAGHGTGKPTAK